MKICKTLGLIAVAGSMLNCGSQEFTRTIPAKVIDCWNDSPAQDASLDLDSGGVLLHFKLNHQPKCKSLSDGKIRVFVIHCEDESNCTFISAKEQPAK